MPKLKDLNPFPNIAAAGGWERAEAESGGSQIIKTELDTLNNVRYDVIHNFFGDEIATIAPLLQKNWLCGYVTFPGGSPLPEEVNNDIEGTANVHGGITYTQKNEDGSFTYGFDCAHTGDGASAKTNDPAWALDEAKRLHKEIMRIRKEWKKHAKAK